MAKKLIRLELEDRTLQFRFGALYFFIRPFGVPLVLPATSIFKCRPAVIHHMGFTEYEIAGVLGIVQSWISRSITAIRKKALVVWGDTPPKPTRVKLSPEEAREKRRAADHRHHKTYWLKHRDELIARQHTRRRDNRAGWFRANGYDTKTFLCHDSTSSSDTGPRCCTQWTFVE